MTESPGFDKSKYLQEEETGEFMLDGDLFRYRVLTGFELSKCMAGSDVAALYQNLFIKALIEPKFTLPEIRQMKSRYFFTIGAKLCEALGAKVDDFLPDSRRIG